MPSWYRIYLSDEQLAQWEHTHILNIMGDTVRLLNENDSRGVAIFDNDANGKYVMYFTPRAAEIGKSIISFYAGEVCEPPLDDGRIGWLAGDKKEWRNICGR
jgi:hypothetical protein